MPPGYHTGSTGRRARSAVVVASTILASAVLAACSAAPTSPNLSTAATTIEREGRFDCNVTRQRMTALATSMSALPDVAKSQSESLPTTAVATFQRLLGPRGSDLQAVEQFEAEKQRYDVLAASARANACATADIDKSYQSALERMAAYRA